MRDLIITEPHKNHKLLQGDLNSELLEKNFTIPSNVSLGRSKVIRHFSPSITIFFTVQAANK